MRTTPFETYKRALAESIMQSADYDALEDKLMEAQWEVADVPAHDTCDEALVAILKKSHAQALAGQTISMEEVECYITNLEYELTHRMDAYCAAEP